MTELAGTAIGAVALGIQVCQGLFKYCSAVKGKSKTIDDISRQIQTLESTFRALDAVLPRVALLQSSDQTVVASVTRCFESCEDGVKDLQKFLDSIGGALSSDDVKDKVKDAGRKLAFGFRQDEVASLLQKVRGLTTTADLALQILSLDVGINHRDQVVSLSEGMASKLALVETEITSTSTAVLTAVDTARRDTSRELAVVSRDMQNRMNDLERIVTSQNEQTHSQIISQGSSRLSGARLLGRPSMLREADDVVNSLSTSAAGARTSSHLRVVSSRCGCDFRQKSLAVAANGIRIGWLVLSDEYHEASRHFPNCPLYTKSKAQRRVSARFGAVVWPRLSVLLQASLACTAGAGGQFSISPQLSFRMTVDGSKNPALREIESLQDVYGPNEGVKRLGVAERRILKMFQAGEASPHDRFPDGSNLLHKLMWIGDSLSLTGSNVDKPSQRHKLIGRISRFIEVLVDAGIPSDEVDLYQSAPVDILASKLFTRHPLPDSQNNRLIELGETLASLSSDMTTLHVGSRLPMQALQMMRSTPILRENLGLPPLAEAILSNSEEHVRSTLAKYPHSIYERTYGMSALHLSSRWPTGLSILLSAGVPGLIGETCNYRFDNSCTALDFALSFNCEEAVTLLFDAGCPWNGFRPSPTLIPMSTDCVRTVARKLADRRERLMCLAEESLPERELATVRRGAGVLDSNAAEVVRLLRDAGVDVPTALAVPDSYATIYLSGRLSIKHFPIFFDHGFHDVNHPIGGCSVPIQLPDVLISGSLTEAIDGKGFLIPRFSQWLKNHGFLDLAPANALPRGTNTSATGLHIMAARLGYFVLLYPKLWGHRRAAYLDIFASRVADGCRCACSSMGCLPLTTSLKVAVNYPFRDYGPGIERWDAFGAEMAGELVRFLTFEALEMTHTCCTRTLQCPPDARFLTSSTVWTLREFEGSIEEIHDEEEELHRRLEELLSEFDAQLTKSGEDVDDFLWGYWKDRMAEECVPVRNGNEALESDSGVIFKEGYETPHRLKGLLGVDFTFRDE